MPAGINNSAINPAAIAPTRTDTPSAQRETPAAAADTQNAQDALAAGGNEAVRAPEPGTASQRADNDTPTTGTGPNEQASTGGAPAPPQQLQAEVGQGIGGNVDITA